MIGKSSFLCSKMTHTEFILIDDVGLSGTVRFPPSWEHFPPFYIFSLLYRQRGGNTEANISFPVYRPLSTYRSQTLSLVLAEARNHILAALRQVHKTKTIRINREITQMLGIPLWSLDIVTYTLPRKIGNEDSTRYTNRSDEALGINASVRL